MARCHTYIKCELHLLVNEHLIPNVRDNLCGIAPKSGPQTHHDHAREYLLGILKLMTFCIKFQKSNIFYHHIIQV